MYPNINDEGVLTVKSSMGFELDLFQTGEREKIARGVSSIIKSILTRRRLGFLNGETVDTRVAWSNNTAFVPLTHFTD